MFSKLFKYINLGLSENMTVSETPKDHEALRACYTRVQVLNDTHTVPHIPVLYDILYCTIRHAHTYAGFLILEFPDLSVHSEPYESDFRSALTWDAFAACVRQIMVGYSPGAAFCQSARL